MATRVNKAVTLKYIGKNPSFTIGRTRLEKGEEITLNANIAEIVMKNGCFEKVVDAPVGGEGGAGEPGDI